LENGMEMNRIRVYNALGEIMLEDVNPTNILDVSSLNRGMYFYEVRLEDGEMLTSRFVKE
jgi:hypothetical protein